jgi:hypothetical protein
MVTRLFILGSPFPAALLRLALANDSTSQIKAAMNMQLFRYLKVAQLGRNAITPLKITNESMMNAIESRFSGVNLPINT